MAPRSSRGVADGATVDPASSDQVFVGLVRAVSSASSALAGPGH